MAGKPSAYASRRLGYALDALSKNALIDIVIELAKQSRWHDYEDESDDATIVCQIQQWLDPVAKARGDRPANLAGRLAQYDVSLKAYDERCDAVDAARMAKESDEDDDRDVKCHGVHGNH